MRFSGKKVDKLLCCKRSFATLRETKLMPTQYWLAETSLTAHRVPVVDLSAKVANICVDIYIQSRIECPPLVEERRIVFHRTEPLHRTSAAVALELSADFSRLPMSRQCNT